ncbi:MAG TPA: pantoate--beta-alanine ligase [Terriglobales bacterium]|jgi:pantoate--beta-alanine ligase|nr:pantoate--beta-alanine ligase [Terriglobales bacterium]
MKIIKTIEEMRELRRAARKSGKRLGLVPTMGALHQGHLSLVQTARDKSDIVAVSIFVNPTQFAPHEDFAKYPRNLENDCQMLEHEYVDVIFAPSVEDMYPAGAVTSVTVEAMSDRLCGKSRPGHFRGVTTVVAKLFHIIEPDIAFFGQKDAAQVAIIRRMVRDLNMPVEIEVGAIVREPDGLALSSRNAYLSPGERNSALVLHRSLLRAQEFFEGGERISSKLIAAGKRELSSEPQARLDYFEIVDPDSLEPITTISNRALIAVAAFIGNTRLIDNLIVDPRR